MAAHLEPAYAGVRHVPLPVTELLTSRSVILPLHHELTPDQQTHVVGSRGRRRRTLVPLRPVTAETRPVDAVPTDFPLRRR